MRAPLRDRRPMAWGARIETKNARAEPTVTFGPPEPFTGVLSAPQDNASAAAYGSRLPSVLRITSADATLATGAGVWVDADRSAPPDYCVVAVAKTPRTIVYTIERRGAYGG